MKQPYPVNNAAEEIAILLVREIRKKDPRLNSGIDLVVYCSIFDEDNLESEMNNYFKS